MRILLWIILICLSGTVSAQTTVEATIDEVEITMYFDQEELYQIHFVPKSLQALVTLVRNHERKYFPAGEDAWLMYNPREWVQAYYHSDEEEYGWIIWHIFKYD